MARFLIFIGMNGREANEQAGKPTKWRLGNTNHASRHQSYYS
jgi:hypothetical protein